MRSDAGLPKPDVVLYLDVMDTQTRGGWGDERYETVEFQNRVRCRFTEMMDSDWKVIDASDSVDGVESRVREIVDALEYSNLGVLWE
jgi:dTMP kinase